MLKLRERIYGKSVKLVAVFIEERSEEPLQATMMM